MIEVGSMVESLAIVQERTGLRRSGLGLVIGLMAEGKIARVFWMVTQHSGFCSVKDLRVIT